ncbi:MAG: response regulator [Pseudanabaena sp. M135S2SP2A07QC]|jgi:CheY-like chemotaxis protein|nr:response regulator [Pseudanabaena sp. M090S1SP2A07QC]MCA6505526.1 response regulator [Pseudanabaena sp. M172S2SP2A07QC]MCA6519694.1 response regulator [Pseudanabaena sp. M110S1SP2A07QC]MCA6523113.1 response regulator [Pseudanabaena sp. M051S1SP2A07QC]MCA6525962.1 response regulator [Pseudanabaena sp. M179S2SP2A07QC]MCA6529084.1 response regulator [Pseudanabaena sp. M125S2SP2A07QC]MCA6535429.1 response regulator [Pseudanabaena sp. M176S2SP2A07QC]MCA6537972.1 response regulator [Pseudanabae
MLIHKNVVMPSEKIDQSQYRILLAEDNLVNQKVAAMMLKKLGYIADIANNGLEVLQMVEKRFYDLILMDMQMPEMDGVTATKIIRQSNQPQPRIIAVTANALEEDRQLCFDAGMNDFVTKPLLIQEINRIIAEYSETKSKKK